MLALPIIRRKGNWCWLGRIKMWRRLPLTSKHSSPKAKYNPWFQRQIRTQLPLNLWTITSSSKHKLTKLQLNVVPIPSRSQTISQTLSSIRVNGNQQPIHNTTQQASMLSIVWVQGVLGVTKTLANQWRLCPKTNHSAQSEPALSSKRINQVFNS